MSDSIIINQCLHGYDSGHSLIASSLSLPKQTLSLLLIMSDAATIGYVKNSPSYLTGYPLPEIGAYALARTWPADDMSRPGCVWTHTIIIDFAELAKIKNLSVLDKVFKQTNYMNNVSFYTKKLILNNKPYNNIVNVEQIETISLIAKSLYITKKDRIVLPRSRYTDDAVLRVWSQQWPKLRRNFKFRTYSNKSSSIDKRFDLCFNNESEVYNSPIIENDEFIEIIINDILTFSNDSLRKFLWVYGADSKHLRECYISLVKIWSYLNKEDNGYYICLAWNEYERYSELSKNLEKKLLIETLSIKNSNFTQKTIVHLFDKILNLKEQYISEDVNLYVGFICSLSGGYIYEFLNKNINNRKVIRTLILDMSDDKLIHVINEYEDTLPLILEVKPSLLCSETLLIKIENKPEIISTLIVDNELANSIVAKCIDIHLINIISLMIKLHGVSIANVLFLKMAGINNEKYKELIRNTLSKNKMFIRNTLLSGNVLPIETLSEISHVLDVSDFSDENVDPWVYAIERSELLRLDLFEFFVIYLFKRGYHNIGCNSHYFLTISFDTLHSMIKKEKISLTGWSDLRHSLSKVDLSWFDRWDRCKKLRKGVVGIYLNNDITPNSFVLLSNDKRTFASLLFEVKQNKKGRPFLKRILSTLNENVTYDQSTNINIKLIKNELDKM